MTLAKPVPHSIWLCPDWKAKKDLTLQIESLCKTSGTAGFAPHLTLLGDLGGLPRNTLDACLSHLVPLGPVCAIVRDVVRTEAYFMSLFLDFDLNPSLDEARERLRVQLGVSKSRFRPHLSLAYGLKGAAMGENEMRTLKDLYCGLEIHLTEICIAASAKEIPIDRWKALKRLRLTN